MKHLRRTLSCFLILLTCLTLAAGLFPARVQASEAQNDEPFLLASAENGEEKQGSFSYVLLLSDHTIVAELPVKLSRQSDTVSIVPARDLQCYLSSSVNVERDITFKYLWDVKELRAPVKLSQKVGTVQAYLGDTLLDETDLVTNYTVSKSLLAELFEYAKYIFLHPVTLLLIALLITFSILRLLRGARMASAAKAGKLVPNDELDTKDGGIPSEESDQSEK